MKSQVIGGAGNTPSYRLEPMEQNRGGGDYQVNDGKKGRKEKKKMEEGGS